MKRVTYRLWVDVTDETDLDKAREIVQDALEGLAGGAVLAVEYQEIGTGEGLPNVRPACTCGAADRWSCICKVQEP